MGFNVSGQTGQKAHRFITIDGEDEVSRSRSNHGRQLTGDCGRSGAITIVMGTWLDFKVMITRRRVRT